MGDIIRPVHGPEWYIQRDLIEFLKVRGWLVERMVGHAWQTGIPDLYCHHPKWEYRWIDVKVEGRYSFTKAQRGKWPKWAAAGVGIWILTGATEQEYSKLFQPPNWREYWKESWGNLPNIDDLLDKITLEG